MERSQRGQVPESIAMSSRMRSLRANKHKHFMFVGKFTAVKSGKACLIFTILFDNGFCFSHASLSFDKFELPRNHLVAEIQWNSMHHTLSNWLVTLILFLCNFMRIESWLFKFKFLRIILFLLLKARNYSFLTYFKDLYSSSFFDR